MKIKTPSAISGVLQAVRPLAIIDGAPFAVSGVSATTIATMVSEAVILYCDTWAHVKLSPVGDPATVNDYIIPADSERVIHCNQGDRLSAIKMSGRADGVLWIWPCDFIA
jgi:hypothetical protein